MPQNLLTPFFALVFSLLPAVAKLQPAHAASIDRPTFFLPVNDGYGVAECLPQGGECAMQVANAWCSAMGYDHASNMQATTDGPLPPRIAVTCNP